MFEASEFRFGLLMSMYGIGAVVIASMATALVHEYSGRTFWSVHYRLWCGEILLASTSFYWAGIAGIFIVGCAHLVMATLPIPPFNFVFQNLCGESHGNVLDGFTIGAPLGSIIQGPLADKFGPQAVVLVMGFVS